MTRREGTLDQNYLNSRLPLLPHSPLTLQHHILCSKRLISLTSTSCIVHPHTLGYECASTKPAGHQTSYVTVSERKLYISSTSLIDTDDWALHLVIAALKCSTDDRASSAYLTADKAKHDILKTLNWFEAHNEYDWPEFAAHLSFDQVMRLRRVLVSDIYTAIERAGHISIGVLGTPDSSDGGVRRVRARDGELRPCSAGLV